jgi:competence protein ComEA
VPGRLELNRASAAELEALPRVGPALAARIVAYRDAHGPFRSVEALDDVPGVGPATLATLRTRVTVSPHAGDPLALPDRNTPR